MPVHSNHGISVLAHDEEAELGISVGTKHRAKRLSVVGLWPTQYSAFVG